MPHTQQFVKPEVFMTHHGVKVYHTYEDNLIENGKELVIFTFNLNDDAGNFNAITLNERFGILDHVSYLTFSKADIKNIIRKSIDRSFIPLPEPYQIPGKVYWKDNIRAELSFFDEGVSGDSNAKDPEDELFLKIDISYELKKDDESVVAGLEGQQDSALTKVNRDASVEVRQKFLENSVKLLIHACKKGFSLASVIQEISWYGNDWKGDSAHYVK